MSSLSSSSSLPLLPPLPFLSLPSPFVPPFFFLLPTLSIPSLPPFTFTLFSIFLFSLSLLFPLLLFLGSSAPQPISSLFLINIPYQTCFFFTPFLFPSASPTITTCYQSNLSVAKWKDSEMLELFYSPKCSHLHFLRAPGRFRPQSSSTLSPHSVFIGWIFTRQFYFCVLFFCIICCL